MASSALRILVIAGSDCSAGAGIQADLKTAQAFGVYAQTAITAVTVQNSLGVSAVHPVPPQIVRGQVTAALEDIGADVIKIGMLGNGAIAAAVADVLAEERHANIPMVLDTVILSSSGAELLDAEGLTVLKARLLRRALLVTPNLAEAEALTGIRPDSEHGARNAMTALELLGAQNVLFKGGHGNGETLRDFLWSDGEITVFEAARQRTLHTHGTGCTLATAIACGLAQGRALNDAVGRAHAYVQQAIRTAPRLGAGHGPLNHN